MVGWRALGVRELWETPLAAVRAEADGSAGDGAGGPDAATERRAHVKCSEAVVQLLVFFCLLAALWRKGPAHGGGLTPFAAALRPRSVRAGARTLLPRTVVA